MTVTNTLVSHTRAPTRNTYSFFIGTHKDDLNLFFFVSDSSTEFAVYCVYISHLWTLPLSAGKAALVYMS